MPAVALGAAGGGAGGAGGFTFVDGGGGGGGGTFLLGCKAGFIFCADGGVAAKLASFRDSASGIEAMPPGTTGATGAETGASAGGMSPVAEGRAAGRSIWACSLFKYAS